MYDLDQDLTEDQQILNQLICNTVEKKKLKCAYYFIVIGLVGILNIRILIVIFGKIERIYFERQ